ncbi:hypothetical protein AB3A32_002617 [Vibrio alginolyticus]
MSKTPKELHQEVPWDGNLDAAAHVSDGEKSMGASMRQIIQARGGESVGDTKVGYAAPNSETWKECSGGTVEAASYPDYAALSDVRRMSTDGITAITNVTSNPLSLQTVNINNKHPKVVFADNKYHFITTKKNEILTLDATDDISTTTEVKQIITRNPALVENLSTASELAHASGNGLHIIACEYNTALDNVTVEITSDFESFETYQVAHDASSMSAGKPWFDSNDMMFYLPIRTSSATKIYTSNDGKSWNEALTTFSCLPHNTGEFSDKGRWFEEDGIVYIYQKWQVNKVNYTSIFLNDVQPRGRVRQRGDSLYMFDYNDSSVGVVEYKGDYIIDTKAEFAGGVADVELFGSSLVVADKNGALYSSTDAIKYTHIGSIPISQGASSIYLSKISEDRCIATVKESNSTIAYQFDFVRSPYDRVFLPDVSSQDGMKTWIKVK